MEQGCSVSHSCPLEDHSAALLLEQTWRHHTSLSCPRQDQRSLGTVGQSRHPRTWENEAGGPTVTQNKYRQTEQELKMSGEPPQ